MPNRDSIVSLQEITASSLREVSRLAVAPTQQKFVASVSFSIAEAYFHKAAWFRAVYADETPIGFFMLHDATLPGAARRPGYDVTDIWLWRFMIDHHFQGAGYGRQAMDLICAHAGSRPGSRRLMASFVPGDGSPEAFYLSYGFAKTGRLVADDTEVEIEIAV